MDFLRILPQKVFEKFVGFDRDGDHHVFGIVKLTPVSLVEELPDSFGNLSELHGI